MELKNYYWDVLVRKWWVIFAATLICTTISAYISFFIITPTYESNATLYVMKNDKSANQSLEYTDIVVIKQLVKDFRVLLTSRYMANLVAENLGVTNLDWETYSKNVTVNQKSDTNVMEIRVKDKDPKMAQDIANTLATSFVEKMADITTSNNIGVTVIDKAEYPLKPAKPQKVINIIVSLILSFFLSLSIVLLYEYLDLTIKTIEDVEKYMNLKVLATIPKMNLK